MSQDLSGDSPQAGDGAYPKEKNNELVNLNNDNEEPDHEEYWMVDNICLQYILTPKLPDKIAGVL